MIGVGLGVKPKGKVLGPTVPVVVPTPTQDVDYNNASDAVGVVMTVPLANIGSLGGTFGFPVTKEPTVDQRYGKKTALVTNTKAIIPVAIIPQVGSYTVLVAVQPTAFPSSRWFMQSRSASIDILYQHNFIGHNGSSIPANGFSVATPGLNGFVVRVYSYNSSTGIMTVYENGNVLGSGPVPTRLGSITSTIFNNDSNAPASLGLSGVYFAHKIWDVALSAAQAAKASSDVRDQYNATYNRFSPANAQKQYAAWGDSLFNTPDTANSVAKKLELEYSPTAYCYPGGVNGETSTAVKTRFDARVVDRHAPNLICCMRNDNASAISETTGIANIQGMIAQLDSPGRYIVQLLHWNNTELAAGPGNAAYDAIDLRRNAQIAAFPAGNILDVGAIIRANTSDSGTHPNAAGAILVAQAYKALLDSKGW